MKTSIIDNGIMLLAVPELSQTQCPDWNRAFTAYVAAVALNSADFAFGALSIASDRWTLAKAKMEREHGIRPKHGYKHGNVEAAYKAATEELQYAEESYSANFGEPLWDAAEKLALTPAPTLQAALFKIEVIKRDELYCHTTVISDGVGGAMALVQRDFDNLTQPSRIPVTFALAGEA